MGIQLTIRLFGTLSLKVPDYDHKRGIVVNAPDSITSEKLLKGIKIPLSHIGVISDGKQAIQRDAYLTNGMTINFFSLLSGG